MEISRWNDLADEHGFIVVYPSGSGFPRVWPMGPRSLGRDVRFISDLIDELEAEYNIDPTRVYADGMSIGGGMAFALSFGSSSSSICLQIVRRAQHPIGVVPLHGPQAGSAIAAVAPHLAYRNWPAPHRCRSYYCPLGPRLAASFQAADYALVAYSHLRQKVRVIKSSFVQPIIAPRCAAMAGWVHVRF